MPFLLNPTDHDLNLSEGVPLAAGEQLKISAADALAYVGHPILEVVPDKPASTSKKSATPAPEES